MVSTLITVASVILIYVTALFIISLIIKRNDIADIAWGPGIFLAGVTAMYATDASGTLIATLLTLGALWSSRLGVRIFLRNSRKSEDPRYKVWRDTWGKWFYVRSYAQVFLLQGALMIVVGYSFIHASVYGSEASLTPLAYAGVALWIVGFFFEVVGDSQLDQFLRDPANKGKLMNRGLWKYSRHPNYFGEVTMWWGICLMVLGTPLGILALISPLAITFLILKVSGIPMAERQIASHHDFPAYKARTSAFFPLPHRRDA